MSQVKLLIYDDGRGLWGPMDDLRSILHARTGIMTNRRRIECAIGQPADAVVVAERLVAVERARENRHRAASPDAGPAAVNPPRYEGTWLAVNGRWIGVGDPPPGVVQQVAGRDVPDLLADPPIVDDPSILSRPWHVLDQLEKTLADDLDAWRGPRVAESARVHPSAVIDESAGPVVIDEHAAIEPLAVIQGPAYIGPHTIVRPHASIRSYTSIGPQCRVGGEVSFSIIQGYANKSHQGFLGHALVGQWVNLGADTTCSNLKNTYGPVRVHLVRGEPPQDTGRMFLGPLIGDHVRTAIGTRINTGSVLGTGSMIVLAGRFTPAHVPPMSFLTDAGCRAYDVDKLLETARIAMARREDALDPAQEQRLRQLAADR